MYKFLFKLQKFLFKIGFVQKNKERQPYHIGWLAPGKTLDDLRLHLHVEWGFGGNFFASIDDGEVLSWRKLSNNEQYHLRVFYDGEIRGHKEANPEGNILRHIFKKGFLEAEMDFLKFLGSFVVLGKTISDLKSNINGFDPNSEIVLDTLDVSKNINEPK